MEPFEDLDARTVTLANTGGTDHLPFDGAGIPAFQFIQDAVAYSTRTHHSNMDNWDHLVEEDLSQAATIIASFVWNTSQRDEKLPRKLLEETKKDASSKKLYKSDKVHNLSGIWKYDVEIPGMEVTGNLEITKNGKGYDVVVNSDRPGTPSKELKSVEAKDNSMKLEYTTTTQGVEVPIVLDLNFGERLMKGNMTAGNYGVFPIKGSKE